MLQDRLEEKADKWRRLTSTEVDSARKMNNECLSTLSSGCALYQFGELKIKTIRNV